MGSVVHAFSTRRHNYFYTNYNTLAQLIYTAKMTRPKTLTHATQERMRQETRRQEDIRSDHLSKLKADSLINTFQQSDERITAKRHLRRLAQEENEREIQKGILITAEEQLANQLETLRLEKMRDEKMRQQIRETSYE